MAAVKPSAVVFLASSADVSASLSCCSCTLRNCRCRLILASSRSFFAKFAARYFRMATLKEITATVSAMAAVMILPWSPRKACRNVQSTELMALIAAPRHCQTPDYTLCVSCSSTLLVRYFDLLFLMRFSVRFLGVHTESAPRGRLLRPGRFPNGACFSKVLLTVRLRHFVPAGNPKSHLLREWPIRGGRPKISHQAVTELSRHLMSSHGAHLRRPVSATPMIPTQEQPLGPIRHRFRSELRQRRPLRHRLLEHRARERALQGAPKGGRDRARCAAQLLRRLLSGAGRQRRFCPVRLQFALVSAEERLHLRGPRRHEGGPPPRAVKRERGARRAHGA